MLLCGSLFFLNDNIERRSTFTVQSDRALQLLHKRYREPEPQ